MGFAQRFHESSAAQQQFADRLDEQTAFDASLTWYLDQVRDLQSESIHSLVDFSSPRRNILTFYGVGGIGKTSLMRRLADRVSENVIRPEHWGQPPNLGCPIAHCMLDAGNLDGEDVILLLRAAVADLGNFPAFDLCLASYWSAAHPESSVADVFRRRGRLASIASSLGISEHIQAAMEDICAALLGTSVPGVTSFRLVSQMGLLWWRKHLEKTALGNCEGLAELVADATNANNLAYLAYAMAWDLQNIQRENGAAFCVFLDGMEEAGNQAERFINILCWMMPNVLFVIGGRNALTWTDGTSDLEFVGPVRWPGLTTECVVEPRQHLVGYLSMQDRRRWLLSSLPAGCGPALVDCIARESQGLPVHLDLILQHVLDVSRVRQVAVEDVKGNIGTVARRVLRDLTAVQRRALLGASLFRKFDIELVRVVADLPNSGPVDEVCRRPYVDKLQGASYGFRLHAVLRDVFVSASGLGDDQWLAEDWFHAAERGAQLLRERLAHEKDHHAYREHCELLFELVDVFGFDFDWLPSVVIRLTSVSNWPADWSRGRLPGLHVSRTWSMDLSDGLAVVMGSQGTNRALIAGRLQVVLSQHRGDARFDVLQYFLAQALRDIGRLADSRSIMESMVDGELRDRALRGLIHVYRREGNFALAEDVLGVNSSIGARRRILGEVRWLEGRISEAERLFCQAADDARDLGDGGEVAMCLAYQAWCYALMGQQSAALEVSEACRRQLRDTHQDFASLMCMLSDALAFALQRGSVEAISAVENNAAALNLTSVVAYARFSGCIAYAVLGDFKSAADELGRLGQLVRGPMFLYLWELANAIVNSIKPDVDDRWSREKQAWLGIRMNLGRGVSVGGLH